MWSYKGNLMISSPDVIPFAALHYHDHSLWTRASLAFGCVANHPWVSFIARYDQKPLEISPNSLFMFSACHQIELEHDKLNLDAERQDAHMTNCCHRFTRIKDIDYASERDTNQRRMSVSSRLIEAGR
jgi:hypothetical protein